MLFKGIFSLLFLFLLLVVALAGVAELLDTKSLFLFSFLFRAQMGGGRSLSRVLVGLERDRWSGNINRKTLYTGSRSTRGPAQPGLARPSLNHVDIGCNNYHPVVFIVSPSLTLGSPLFRPDLIAVASVNDIVCVFFFFFFFSSKLFLFFFFFLFCFLVLSARLSRI